MVDAVRFGIDHQDLSVSVPIYCINLSASRERRARMTRRFEHFGLLDRARFIRAIDRRSPLVDQRLTRIGNVGVDAEKRALTACLLSHMRALRTFLREAPSTAGSAIIFEDDVLLHRDWHELLEDVLANLPDGAPVCALGYNDEDWDRPHESWEGFTWAGRDPERRNLIRVLTRQWGAHAYWISRAHARFALQHFESEIINPPRAPEFIQKAPGAFSAFPALAIQDGMPSTIRREVMMHSHRTAHSSWGIQNYFSDDEDKLTKRSHGTPTICLCAMVWNEADLIDRLATSVEGLIDTWVICDSGSTDGTPERVSKAFAGVPGRLYHDSWHDDGTNRSLMLERARGTADYLLLLDASQTVQLREQLTLLTADAYSPLVVGPGTGWLPMLVRGDLPWRAVGTIDAELVCDEPYRIEPLERVAVRRDEDEDHRLARLRRSLDLAERAVAEQPNDRENLFALAEVCRGMGDDDRAIALYVRRLELGGAPDQMWEAMYRHAELVAQRNWDEGINLLLETWEFHPARPEPLWSLAHGYRVRDQFTLAGLFAARGLRVPQPAILPPRFRHIYEWGLKFEWSIAASRTGDPQAAARVSGGLLGVPTVPDDIHEEIREHYWSCRFAEWEQGPGSRLARVPTLASLVSETKIGQLRLELDPSVDQTNPSVANDGDGLRSLLQVSQPGNPWAVSYCEVELDADLSVVAARIISDDRSPAAIPLAAFRHCHLVRAAAEWLVVGSPTGSPSGSSPAVVLRLVDGRFVDPELLATAGADNPDRWAPFVMGGELMFVSSFSPATVLRFDQKTGELISAETAAGASDELREERAASQGIPVADGTLFVTHRGVPGEPVEHRFVLLDERLEVAGASSRFCFLNPSGEFCSGLAVLGEDLILSFAAAGGREAFLARTPYRAVAAMLGPQ
jgi:GR25 family glycosyltransferase involved in LPS biosynthesis